MAADFSVSLEPTQKVFQSNEIVTLKAKYETRQEDAVWDTYLYFTDSRNTPIYIGLQGNSLSPEKLGMLPPEIRLRPHSWKKDEVTHVFLYLCKVNTHQVLAIAHAVVRIEAVPSQIKPLLPSGAQLLFIQEFMKEEEKDRYTDYKQFDSQWKNTAMGQYNGTTIGSSGCAISSAGNIRGATPATINTELKADGGYSGNSIIWGKVRGLSYKGAGTISDTLFSSYHVIADLGGHFVLLTGCAGTEKYYSKDPGKSSNPIYTRSQVHSVRLYYR